MLRITQSRSAEGAKRYYCEEYYKEGQSLQLDYYSDKEQLIGKWGGKAAERLGLTGDIAKRDFAALCDNQMPLTGKKLTGRNDSDRTVGYDFTFSASKSISLLYALGNESEKRIILDAFQESVHETMAEIEKGMQARVRVKGKNENRMTGNIVYGAFTHFSTRPLNNETDPHLHAHCFVLNSTFDFEESKWKAGDFRQVKQDAPYYEAVFFSKLAQKIQDEGYDIERTKGGFELAGITRETIQKFSRRTQEIEDYSREHNITDEKEKAQIGAKTREAKHASISNDQQETAWLNRLSETELNNLRNLKRHARLVNAAPSNESAALDAVQSSLSHHLERKSVASDKEILATAIKSSIGQATPEQVKKAFNQNTSLLTVTEKFRTFITTKDALKEEQQLIVRCTESKNKFRPINEGYMPTNPQLNDQQKAAVRHALSSTDGIIIITGKAGTGKTFLMKEILHGIQDSGGKQIYSFAPSSEASRGVQRSEGFENADTVAKLIHDTALHSELKRQVIWIDEAGMLSNQDMNKVLAIADAQGARVILSGDTRQHNSVDRGDALRVIQQHAEIRPITVSKIQRQKNKDYKEAVQLLSSGNVEKGFKKLDHIGAIHEMTDSQSRVAAIADEYYISAYAGVNRAAKEVLVVAPTHAEGDIVTRQIRQTLKDKKVIGQEEHGFKVLKSLQLTEAEKLQPENYKQGDVVVFYQNSKGVKAGKKMEVVGAEENKLTARDSDGLPYQVALSESKKYTVFEPRHIQVADGDKIRITGNGKSNEGTHLFNGTAYNILGFDQQGNIKLSNGSTISQDFGHFNLGYVSTSHSSQGKTADKVIISQSSSTFRASSMEQFYVSVSRGKQAVSIYTDDKEHLQQAVSHSAQRISATELMAKRQEQAQEINRISRFRTWQEKATETYDHLKSKFRNDGLQAATRTE